MGLDYGTRRVGVALSDPLHLTAQPHCVIEVDAELVEHVRRIALEYEVECVVVGLPVSLNGREGPSAEGARRLAARVAERTGLPVELSDERFTTKTAEEVLIGGNVRRHRRRQIVDKMAAAIMLQHFLDRQ
jgi:putative Holliday junction resolvase